MAYYPGCIIEKAPSVYTISFLYDVATGGDAMYLAGAWGTQTNYYQGVEAKIMTKNNPYMYVLESGVWKEAAGSLPDAAEVPFIPHGVIDSTDVQGAIEELEEVVNTHSHGDANTYAYAWFRG